MLTFAHQSRYLQIKRTEKCFPIQSYQYRNFHKIIITSSSLQPSQKTIFLPHPSIITSQPSHNEEEWKDELVLAEETNYFNIDLLSIYFIIRIDNKFMSEHEKGEESMGYFEEFTQQFTTYTASDQQPPTSIGQLKIVNSLKKEKPKLKIINQEQQKGNLERLITQNKKPRKNVSANSKVIAIGEAIFKSNFQSGNLEMVEKVAPAIYQITLTKQLNSDRVSAWFYFAAEGLKGEIKFIIKGFTKSTSLYNQGMKLCYRQAQQGKWRRGGSKICYTDSYSENQQSKQTYQLHFSFFFKSNYPNSVEFAYCFPYTYTHLIKFLSFNYDKMSIGILGKTYQNRDIPLITIGNPHSKYVIIISARAHPGETVGSWMMEGFLKELISDSEYSKHLRQCFLFKIVPMINPDGVINGNYRFSGSGFDLNRKWKVCSQKMHPQVYRFRHMIREINKQKEIIMFIDLHGHSRQKNVFFYGCCPKGQLDQSGILNTKPKQFPFLMSKIHPPFRYDYCSYSMQKQKQGTARIALWNELKIDYVYTLEASFCGADGVTNFLILDYQKIGSKLVEGICLHFWELIKQITPKSSNERLLQNENKIIEEINKNMSQFFENPDIAKIQYDGNSSDSEPQAGEIPQQQRKKQKSVISIQKYYKATRIMKFTQKNLEDDSFLKTKNSFIGKADQNLRNKTNQSTILSKQNDSEIRKMLEKNESKNLSTQISAKSQNHFYVRSQFLNRTINQRLKFDIIHKHPEENENKNRFVSQPFLLKNENDEICYLNNKNEQERNKKKVIGFEGAQYRRVRKLAEEHNRRHFSAQQTTEPKQDDALIRGLVGMNNLIQIERVGSKQSRHRTPSFFPNTTHYGNKKRKSGSMDMHFRRHIKATDYTSRLLYVNGLQQQVKCYGKQIL